MDYPMEQMHVGTISDEGKPSHYVKEFMGDITPEKVADTIGEMLGQNILVYVYVGLGHPLKHFLPENCRITQEANEWASQEHAEA